MNSLIDNIYRKNDSICGTVRQSHRLIIVLMSVPFIILAVLLFICLYTYNGRIRNLERAMRTEEDIRTETMDLIWDVITGKEDPSHLDASILNEARAELEELNHRGEDVYITASEGAVQMLEDEIGELQLAIRSGASVYKQEKKYGDIRSVASTVSIMLDSYNTAENERIARTNRTAVAAGTGILAAVFLLVLFIILFSIHTSEALNRKIARPLNQMIGSAHQIAGGNFQIHLDSQNLAELRDLNSELEDMAGKLRDLVNTKLRYQEELDEAEHRILLEQIRPHFLYNTLSTTIWLSEKQDYEGVTRITRALATFLRISLSQGKSLIPVADERRHIAAYLEIQQIRYRSVLRYDICIDSELDGFYIEKMLLQPLVENAIYHGIKEKTGGGHILVKGCLAGEGKMKFSVSDTGQGMSPEKLLSLRERLENMDSQEDRESIGLFNVARRIQILSRGEEVLEIDSREGEGTTVWFCLPAYEEGSHS